jgi:hypothetical protein
MKKDWSKVNGRQADVEKLLTLGIKSDVLRNELEAKKANPEYAFHKFLSTYQKNSSKSSGQADNYQFHLEELSSKIHNSLKRELNWNKKKIALMSSANPSKQLDILLSELKSFSEEIKEKLKMNYFRRSMISQGAELKPDRRTLEIETSLKRLSFDPELKKLIIQNLNIIDSIRTQMKQEVDNGMVEFDSKYDYYLSLIDTYYRSEIAKSRLDVYNFTEMYTRMTLTDDAKAVRLTGDDFQEATFALEDIHERKKTSDELERLMKFNKNLRNNKDVFRIVLDQFKDQDWIDKTRIFQERVNKEGLYKRYQRFYKVYKVLTNGIIDIFYEIDKEKAKKNVLVVPKRLERLQEGIMDADFKKFLKSNTVKEEKQRRDASLDLQELIYQENSTAKDVSKLLQEVDARGRDLENRQKAESKPLFFKRGRKKDLSDLEKAGAESSCIIKHIDKLLVGRRLPPRDPLKENEKRWHSVQKMAAATEEAEDMNLYFHKEIQKERMQNSIDEDRQNKRKAENRIRMQEAIRSTTMKLPKLTSKDFKNYSFG